MGTGARCRTERHLTIGLCQPTFLWTGGATPTQPTRQVRQIRQTVAARARCQQRIPGVPTVGQIHTGALAATPAALPTAGSAEPPTLPRAPSARLIMSTPECEGSLAKQQKSPPTRLHKSSSCQIKYLIAEKK